jgi:hypothetical protein
MGRRPYRERARNRRADSGQVFFPAPPGRGRLARFRDTEPAGSAWERAWSGRLVSVCLAVLGLAPTVGVVALLVTGSAADPRPLPAVALLAAGGTLATASLYSRRARVRARLAVASAACLAGSCLVMQILGALLSS